MVIFINLTIKSSLNNFNYLNLNGNKCFEKTILMSQAFIRFKQWLGRLSFRTGIIVAILCIISYIVSLAQILLPISATMKGVLWTVFFGLAKTFQYTALLILGTAGLARAKAILKWRK